MFKHPAITNMLLEVIPDCVHHVEIFPPLNGHYKGHANCTILLKYPFTKTFYIKTPPPLKSKEGLLIFLHECAHITLGHNKCYLDLQTLKSVATHPHYRTYYSEIMAWAKVDRWLDQYNIIVDGKKAIVQSALEHAWKTLK